MYVKKQRKGYGLAVGVVVLLLAVALGSLAAPARAAITPAWMTQLDMAKARSQAAVVQDSSGLVYVIGGVETIGGYTDIANVFSYNTTTGASHDLAPLPQPTRGAAAALGPDGRIYVFGGWNNTLGALDNTQIYDPKTDAWSAGTAVPERVWEAKAASSNTGLIYVIGGETPSAFFSNAVRVYDPVADSWTTSVNMPVGTKAGALVSTGYYLYYIGGATATGTTSNVELFYTWGSWSAQASLPVPVAGLAAVMGADGFIYAFGGAASYTDVNPGYNTTFVYDRFQNVWSNGPEMPVSATYLGGAATSEGRIFVLGGNDNTAIFNQVKAMRVMSISAVVSPATVGQGRSVTVSITTDFAFAVPRSYNVGASLVAAGVTYGGVTTNTPLPGTVAFVVTVPQTVAPGPAQIYVFALTVYYDSGSSNVPVMWLPITVTASPTLDEQVAALQDEIHALQDQLNDTHANITSLQTQVAILQAQLNGLQAGLGAMGAGQAVTTAQLNATLADLQRQLNDFQTQINRIENKADNGGTLSLVTVVLIIVIIVLLVALIFRPREPRRDVVVEREEIVRSERP